MQKRGSQSELERALIKWRIFVLAVSTYALVVGVVIVLFFLAYTLLEEELLAKIVNPPKEISIPILCQGERTLRFWALCLVCYLRVSSSIPGGAGGTCAWRRFLQMVNL